MGRSIILSKGLQRPSVIILVGFLLLAIHGTQMKVAGNPLPDAEETSKNVSEHLQAATNNVKDFFERAKNTFSGKADDTNPGLTTWELAGVIAGAVLLFFFFFCCIGFCLCECVKELICCICCCGCCRD